MSEQEQRVAFRILIYWDNFPRNDHFLISIPLETHPDITEAITYAVLDYVGEKFVELDHEVTKVFISVWMKAIGDFFKDIRAWDTVSTLVSHSAAGILVIEKED